MSLSGKRVVNTRAAHQAASLDFLLFQHSAVPLAYPCIAIVPPEDTAALDRVLAKADFDLLILTSTNTVSTIAERLQALGKSWQGQPAAAVGTTTAQAARDQLGVEITLIPDHYSGDDLARALNVTEGMRMLLPQSEIAQMALADSLRERGADVTAITAYRTVKGSGGVQLAPMLRQGEVDAVTFTSASTARHFLERLRDEGGAPLDGVTVACIGAQTARTARELGLNVVVEAQPHTLEGLVEHLAAYFQEQLP